jgi:hypothetical protein
MEQQNTPALKPTLEEVRDQLEDWCGSIMSKLRK